MNFNSVKSMFTTKKRQATRRYDTLIETCVKHKLPIQEEWKKHRANGFDSFQTYVSSLPVHEDKKKRNMAEFLEVFEARFSHVLIIKEKGMVKGNIMIVPSDKKKRLANDPNSFSNPQKRKQEEDEEEEEEGEGEGDHNVSNNNNQEKDKQKEEEEEKEEKEKQTVLPRPRGGLFGNHKKIKPETEEHNIDSFAAKDFGDEHERRAQLDIVLAASSNLNSDLFLFIQQCFQPYSLEMGMEVSADDARDNVNQSIEVDQKKNKLYEKLLQEIRQ